MKETLRSDFEVPEGSRKCRTTQRLTDEQDDTTIDAPRRLEESVPMHPGFGADAVNVRHRRKINISQKDWTRYVLYVDFMLPSHIA